MEKLKVVNPIELAATRLDDMEEKIKKTREVLDNISGVPAKIKVAVRPGSITFKLEDAEVSFKALVDEIKSKFRVKLDKEFNGTNGRYFLQAKVEDAVTLKITNIPPPEGCGIKMREVEVVQKKKEFLAFGQCTAIVR